MAPWGKVHSAWQHVGSRVKSGLLWASHVHKQGLHLASRTNDLYNTGKQVAGMFMPALDRLAGSATTGGVVNTFGKLDALRDQATAGYSRMEDKVRENSDIVAAARQARPMLQPFLS